MLDLFGVNIINRKLIYLALFLRVLIMPFLYHPDIRVYNSQSQFLSKGVVNIYQYLTDNKDKLYFKEEFVYFPVAYFYIGTYQTIIKPVLGEDFTGWLNGGETYNIYRYLFFLKLPYLIFDFAIGFLLAGLFNKKEDKKNVLTLWLFNPFSILLIYAYSNIDVIPVLMVVASLYLLSRNKYLMVGVILALGTGVKAFPALFAPALLVSKQEIIGKAKNLGIFISLLAALLIPFWGKSFLNSSLSSGLTNRIFETGFDIGLPRKIPFFLVFYCGLFIYFYLKNTKKNISESQTKEIYWKYYLSILLILLPLISYHIQWLLWILPLMALAIVKRKISIYLASLLIIIGFFKPILLNDKYMTVALYSQISSIYLQVSTPYLYLTNIINVKTANLIIQNIFAILSASILFIINKNDEK